MGLRDLSGEVHHLLDIQVLTYSSLGFNHPFNILAWDNVLSFYLKSEKTKKRHRPSFDYKKKRVVVLLTAGFSGPFPPSVIS
jgi:hypothetical protein